MTTISLLTTDELPNAFALEKICHLHPWNYATFLSNQGVHYYNIKLSTDEKLYGFAITQIITDEATLLNLAIHPDHQNRGYGKQLLESLIEELHARHVTTLWLEVRASNIVAQKLYFKVGFNEITRRSNYYPSKQGREDAIIMAYVV